jgi:hypothetical protein
MLYTQILRLLTGAISGILFGSGMIISGMVDPNKVIAFLDIFGEWDPSLAFVMGGALLVFTPIYHCLIKPRKQPKSRSEITFRRNNFWCRLGLSRFLSRPSSEQYCRRK